MFTPNFAISGRRTILPALLFAGLSLALPALIHAETTKAAPTAAHPLTVVPTYTQQQELTASDGVAGIELGDSVALSSDGNTALVGALNGNGGHGATYVFIRSGTTWTQQRLVANDCVLGDQFGVSVALSSDGNTALIGALGKNTNQGAVYLFTRSGSTFSQQQEFTSSDGVSGDEFGASVALSSDGNTALVGANSKNSSQGAAYVFTRSGSTFTQRQELTASDGIAGIKLGGSVALSSDGTIALVGALNGNGGHGAAYVFTLSGSTSSQQKLVANDCVLGDQFGNSVTLSSDGNTALIAALGRNTNQGAVYLFTRSGSTFSQQQEFAASDGASGAEFGTSVSLSSDGNTALVGAALMNTNQGVAYMFTRSGSAFSQEQELNSSDGASGDKFGSAVAFSNGGSTAVVGALGKNSIQGSAYVFVLPVSSSATYIGQDTTTLGAWTGFYGSDGQLIANDMNNLPTYASTTAATGDRTYTWTNSTSDPRALQTASGSSSLIASTFYSTTSFTVNANLTDGNAHQITLYLLDWDSNARNETISILDAVSKNTLDSRTFSNFHDGQYVSWNVRGNVLIQVTKNSGPNAVVSGIFFDPSSSVAPSAAFTTAQNVQGVWPGTYGQNGALIANDTATLTSLPAYAKIEVQGDRLWTWSTSTTDPRALDTSTAKTALIASAFYSSTGVTIDVNLTDGNTHQLALYLLDWDSTTRAETITVLNPENNQTLAAPQSYSGFHNGTWAVLNITGHVLIQVNKTTGSNAVISGIFLN